MRDVGQNVVQSSVLNRKCWQPQLLPHFLLIAFLEEAFVRNIIIILCLNFIFLMCSNNNNNNNNNAVINTNL